MYRDVSKERSRMRPESSGRMMETNADVGHRVDSSSSSATAAAINEPLIKQSLDEPWSHPVSPSLIRSDLVPSHLTVCSGAVLLWTSAAG